MEDKTWKTALWDTSWEELHSEEFSVTGDCRFTETGGAILDIPFGDISKTKTLVSTGKYASGISPVRHSYLFGITQDGTRLVLKDALSKGVGGPFPGSTHETLTATAVFSAKHEFDPTLPIHSIRFRIDPLSGWLNAFISRPAPGADKPYVYGEDPKAIPLFSSPEMNFTLRIKTINTVATATQIALKRDCLIAIEYSEPRTVDAAWIQDLTAIQSLFALCLGFYPSVSGVAIQQEHEAKWIRMYRSCANTKQKHSNAYPIPFNEIGFDGLSHLASAWMSMDGDLKHAAMLLTSLLGSWSMPLDLQLHAATTMLEALARSNERPLYTEEKFHDYTDPLIAIAAPSIRGRVGGILGLLKNKSYGMLLDSIYEQSLPWGAELIPNWKRFKKEQYNIRNAGAHGKKSQDDPHVCIDHFYAQIILGYIILLKRLEASEAVIDSFMSSGFLNVSRWNISQRYSRKDSLS